MILDISFPPNRESSAEDVQPFVDVFQSCETPALILRSSWQAIAALVQVGNGVEAIELTPLIEQRWRDESRADEVESCWLLVWVWGGVTD